jgi:hypothetical protein
MVLAESMKNFVNDVKASRRSRHEFVKGNRENTKNIMADNRKFLQNIQAQNKINAEQTRMFLQSSREARIEDFKKSSASRKNTIQSIHQAKEAIRQGARAMIKEFRDDNEMAHKYWVSLNTDEPIPERKSATLGKSSKKAQAIEIEQQSNKAIEQ